MDRELVVNTPSRITFTITADIGESPTLIETSNFLGDFNMIYEVTRLAADPQYADQPRSRFTLYRDAWRPDDFERLQLLELTMGSPLIFVVQVIGLSTAALSAILLFLRIVEKAATIGLAREKLNLEVELLKRQLSDAEEQSKSEGLDQKDENDLIGETIQEDLLEYLERRIQKSSIKIIDINISYEE